MLCMRVFVFVFDPFAKVTQSGLINIKEWKNLLLSTPNKA